MSIPLFILCSFSLLTRVSCLRLVDKIAPNSFQERSLDEIGMNWNASSNWDFFMKDASPVKLLFFAGLEGSGHHLMDSVIKRVKGEQIVKHKYDGFGKSKWNCGEWHHEGKEEVVREWKELKPGLHILPWFMSYPMCGAGNHDGRAHKFHPRIDWMKEAADEAGIKLHIIYLYRHVPDCLAADCIHRAGNFTMENCSSQTETLFHNAAELVKQLQTISKSDYSCFRYGDMDSMRSVIQENFGAESGNLIDVIFQQHPSKAEREREEGWSNFESQLGKTNLEMSLACSDAHSTSFSQVLKYFEYL